MAHPDDRSGASTSTLDPRQYVERIRAADGTTFLLSHPYPKTRTITIDDKASAAAARYVPEIRDLCASLRSLVSIANGCLSDDSAASWNPEIAAIRARLRLLLGIE